MGVDWVEAGIVLRASALFQIDADTGVLSFISAPDFETPGDAGGDNDYDVIVRASDGTLTDKIEISVLAFVLAWALTGSANSTPASWLSAPRRRRPASTSSTTQPQARCSTMRTVSEVPRRSRSQRLLAIRRSTRAMLH